MLTDAHFSQVMSSNSALRSRAAVELENLALRHQIGVLHPLKRLN